MAFVAEGELKVSEAANILGVHPVTIRRHAKALGINPRAARAALLVRLAKVAHLFAPLFDLAFKDRL